MTSSASSMVVMLEDDTKVSSAPCRALQRKKSVKKEKYTCLRLRYCEIRRMR